MPSKKPFHEHWGDYTTKEIIAIKRAKCVRCPYHGVMSARSGDATTVYCNYLEIVGEARLIRPELCEHYLDQDTKRTRPKFGYSRSISGLSSPEVRTTNE